MADGRSLTARKETTMALLHPMHLALVALVVLLVFGPRKLPELARGVGEAMKELKQTLRTAEEAAPGARAASGQGSLSEP
jgi:sec-independent protein translocase protein TatA